MTRSPTLASALFIALALIACAARSAGAAPPSQQRPNLIFILADDLGYGDLACYGQKHIKTPHLDRMAAEGVRFTDFYAGSTVCTPSRCVLMTGQHSGRAWLRGNSAIDLRPQDVTVAEVLRAGGYRTAHVGKWGLGREGGEGVPTKQGFDSFYGYLNNMHAHNYYPAYLIRDEGREPLKNVVPGPSRNGEGVAAEKVQYSHDLFTEETLKFLDAAKPTSGGKGQPFFLYLCFTIPHANNEAKNKGMEVPELGEYADKDWPEPNKGHAAMITRMDRDVGRILDKLKELGLDENTAVFFSSDNGPHKEGGQDPALSDSNGPFKGTKRDLYDGGIRVPLIARWPGKIPPGRTSDHVSGHQDVMATLAELAGAESHLPKHDGVSLVPTLLGKPDQQKKHEYLYWEFYEQKGARAVRMGNWKAVRKPLAGGKTELYHIKKDPGEESNLATQHPDLVAKAEAIMKRAHVPNEHFKLPESE